MIDQREVLNHVRYALELAAQSRQPKPASILEELEAESEYALRTIQEIIDGMAKQRRLWITNDMDSMIKDPSTVFTGKYNAERWAEIKTLFDTFAKWVETPNVVVYADTELGTPEVAIPPIVTVSRRNNPPKDWGIKQEEDLQP